ncbi:twin-arginine translocation signal domain-containing protein, partial [Parasutterella excrementihominis]
MKTNRRNFLKLSGAAALTASTPAWAVPTNQPEKWDEEYDIVIIGAGGAG